MSITTSLLGVVLNTHKQVIRIRIGPANSEELHQVMKLPMYISTNRDWTFLFGINLEHHISLAHVLAYHRLDVGLILEYLSCLGITNSH